MIWVGWLAHLALALCAVPQAWLTWKTKDASGLSWIFLGLWGVGEIGGLVYVSVFDAGLSAPLVVNYSINIGCIGGMLYVKSKY